jgi:GT2 family glycosyltransferase
LSLVKHQEYLPNHRERLIFVSIIVVTLGRNITDLKECLESLLVQTYTNFEILIIVDASSPKIRTVLNYYEHENRVKLFFNDNVIGISRARNLGIREAKGDIVAFIDDDAVALTNWVENLVKCYDNNIAAAGGKVVLKNPPFHKILIALNQEQGNDERLVDFLVGCNMSFRKNNLLDVGLFNPSIDYGNDETELAIRLVSKGYKIKYCPTAVVKHDDARTWKKLIWKHFKFGEHSLILPATENQSQRTTSYKHKLGYFVRCFIENGSISVVIGLSILYVVRRIGVAKAIFKKGLYQLGLNL